LNQYEFSSLWGFDTLQANGTVEDYGGMNDLTGVTDITLSRDVLNDPDVDRTCLLPDNSLASLYSNNSCYITEADQDGGLDLRSGQFTIWQWFRIIDSDLMDPTLNYFTLLSKWVSTGSTSDKSYRLSIVHIGTEEDTINGDFLRFEINDGGTIKTLTSSTPLDFDPSTTIGLEDIWSLVVVRLNYIDQKLEMFLNNELVGSITLTDHGQTPLNDSTFYIGNEQWTTTSATSYRDGPRPYGFIAETAISKDVLSDDALTFLWNNGNGSFYIP
jgi:hypothetical protein